MKYSVFLILDLSASWRYIQFLHIHAYAFFSRVILRTKHKRYQTAV